MSEKMRTHIAIMIATLVFTGCGSVSKDPPLDGLDIEIADTAGDTTGDTTPADTPVDTAVDTVTDSPVDTSTDTIADTAEWPTENPTDWPYETHLRCDSRGGFCSGGEEIPCPWGYRIIEDYDLHRRCADDGWCCVIAPYSECSDSETANCIWNSDCTSVDGGCWSDATPAMDCGTDRVCCVNTCG